MLPGPLPPVDLTKPVDESLTDREALAIISRLLKQAGLAVQTIGGTLGFILVGGPDGLPPERWLVRLDVVGGHWEPGGGDATVTVLASREAFPAVINAPDRVDLLRSGGLIRVIGDTDRLERLARLLSGAGNRISVRFPGGL